MIFFMGWRHLPYIPQPDFSCELVGRIGNAPYTAHHVRHAAIGVEKDSRPPLPPNRTCGFPAYGSPVKSFLIGIGSLQVGLYTE